MKSFVMLGAAGAGKTAIKQKLIERMQEPGVRILYPGVHGYWYQKNKIFIFSDISLQQNFPILFTALPHDAIFFGEGSVPHFSFLDEAFAYTDVTLFYVYASRETCEKRIWPRRTWMQGTRDMIRALAQSYPVYARENTTLEQLETNVEFYWKLLHGEAAYAA